jgi:hypothetical protein
MAASASIENIRNKTSILWGDPKNIDLNLFQKPKLISDAKVNANQECIFNLFIYFMEFLNECKYMTLI